MFYLPYIETSSSMWLSVGHSILHFSNIDFLSHILSCILSQHIFYLSSIWYFHLRFSDILSGFLSDIYSGILFDSLSGILADILCGLLSDGLFDIHSDSLSDINSIWQTQYFDMYPDILCDNLSDIPSDMYSDILSDILSSILPDMYSSLSIWRCHWHSVCHFISRCIRHTFWHSIRKYYDILADILFGLLSDSLSDIHSDNLSDIVIGHSIWHIFWHSYVIYYLTHIFRQFISCSLIGGLNPSEKYDFVSCSPTIPKIWKVIKFHGSGHYQPVLFVLSIFFDIPSDMLSGSIVFRPGSFCAPRGGGEQSWHQIWRPGDPIVGK